MVMSKNGNTSRVINMTFNEIAHLFDGMKNQPCCRQRIGLNKSLLLGFGKKIPHNKPKRRDTFNAEWELGTYTSAWRVMQANDLVIGSSDSANHSSLSDFDDALQKVVLGRFLNITFVESLKLICLALENDMQVHFFPCSSDDDEWFHVFMPDKTHLEYTQSEWSISKL